MLILNINGKIIIIPKDKDKANKYMYHFAKLFEQDMQNNSSYIPKKNNAFVQSLKFNPPPINRKPKKNPATPRKKNPYCK